MRSTWAKTLALLGLGLFLAAGGARGEPLPIRIGWTAVPNELMPLAFQKTDLLKHAGKSYTVALEHYAGSGPLITAFATGEVDIASLSPTAFGNAVVTAGLKQLRVVADGLQDGVEGHRSTIFFVRKDGPVHTVEDLKGKVVAVNAFGGSIDLALHAMMRKHGLRGNRDYTSVEVQFPNMPAVLADGKVDLVSPVPPFSYMIEDRGIGRALFTSRDAVGPAQTIFYAMRADFIAQHRAAVVDFFEDYVRVLHWYLDPANRDAAIAAVSRFTKRPPQFFSGWVLTAKDTYHDPNALPNLEVLQRNIATAKDLGFIKAAFTVADYTDLSLVKEAAARLGKP